MTQFLSDSFTDTAGTLLSAHVGEVGATWTRSAASTAGAEMAITAAGRVRGSGTVADVYYVASGAPGVADYDVTGVFRKLDSTASIIGIYGRMSTSANTGYRIITSAVYDDQWILSRLVGGVQADLAFYAGDQLTGVDYTTKLEMRGTTIKGYVNGVERLSATDSGVTTVGRGGVYAFDAPPATGGWQLASVLGEDTKGLQPQALLDWRRNAFPFMARGDRGAEGRGSVLGNRATGGPRPAGGFERFIFPRLHPIPTATVVSAAADLTGLGDLSAAGDVTISGSAALTGTGALVVAGMRTRLGVAALTGSGSSTAAGVRTRLGAAALTGTGSLTAAGAHTGVGAAALVGNGTLSSNGTRTRFGQATLDGTGSSTAAGVRTRLGAAALTGAGALTAAGVRTRLGAADLSGSGSSTTAGTVTRGGAAALTGDGTLTAAGARVVSGAADLTGTGSLTAAGDVTIGAAAALTGAGSLTAAGDHIATGAAALVGNGTLTTDGTRVRFGQAALTGAGSSTVAGGVTYYGAAALTGTGTLAADGTVTTPVTPPSTGSGAATTTRERHVVIPTVIRSRADLHGRGWLRAEGTVDDDPEIEEFARLWLLELV